MTKPLVSVVIETVTAREGDTAVPPADCIGGALDALGRQTWPPKLIEPIVVIDGEMAEADAAEIRRRYPSVKVVSSADSNYLAAKNAGAQAATGDIVALLDADCVPADDWLQTLLAPLERDESVAAVGGRTRYGGGSWAARTFSVPDFAYVLAGEDGVAAGFVINNVAFRREVILAHPFEARIRRDGGCYLLFHQLRAQGLRVLIEPRAIVEHAPDVGGLGFARKHFKRGYDGVAVYRLDADGVLRGTRLLLRIGPVALLPITGRRIAADWLRLVRHRRQLGITPLAVPYFGAVAVVTRFVELAGGLAACISPESSNPKP